jgi:GAF domain-containing protein
MEINNELSFIDTVNHVIDKSLPLVSNLSNVSSVIKMYFKNTSWAGFYISDEKQEVLYLGPFQGSLACTTIPFNKGVCGKSAYLKKTLIVDNVLEFEGHIACSSSSRSEIVVPIIKENKVLGVIDLDSDLYSNYSLSDQELLEKCAEILSDLF